jgi:hypothetical protein
MPFFFYVCARVCVVCMCVCVRMCAVVRSLFFFLGAASPAAVSFLDSFPLHMCAFFFSRCVKRVGEGAPRDHRVYLHYPMISRSRRRCSPFRFCFLFVLFFVLFIQAHRM